MSSTGFKYLLDVNVLIALGDVDHRHHRTAVQWFRSSGSENWGVCPITDAGFVRITTHPSYPGTCTLVQATDLLAGFAAHPGYRYWPICDPWTELASPLLGRIFGHQQVTDASLLGLAIKNDGILVTFDKTIRYLAGPEYSRHLLVLETR
jgi:toxin-antitoxin system PIN domain toxin